MSVQAIADSAQICKNNAKWLREMAQSENNADVKKLLLVAAHHLDVGVAELDYILTEATVSI
ncbi:MAG TPA: hypothetical protein VHR47_07745 [Bacillota bacterium]|nr:hypothetical protein [Bacillota bacterium]